MNEKITLSASKIKRKKKIIKISKIALLVFLLFLLIIYIVVSVVYHSGNFTITLDKNLYFDKNIIIYDNSDYKVFRTELYAKAVEALDNISYKWLPDDLDAYEGSNNGENYVAYSFYIENFGDKASDYWSETEVVDVIKQVDEAVRIRIYKNGEYITYAKLGKNGNAEKNTIAFTSDDLIVREHVENLKPGERIKYTVVIWIEGSDPECTDNILGGEIKIQMNFNSEFIEK